MAFILTDEQKVTLTIQPLTAAGHPAAIDGVPVWVSSAPGVVMLEPAANGLSCVALSDQLGTAQVQVTADADLGAGVRTLTALIDIQVVPAEAVSLGIVAGVPELK